MKPRTRGFDFGLSELLLMVAIFGLLALMAMPAAAQTNVFQPNFYKSYTVTLTNGQTLVVGRTNFWDTIRQGSGESIWLKVQGTNTTAANVTSLWDVNPDGTTWTTGQPFTFIQALNSTTAQVGYTNLPATAVNNCRQIGLYSLQNAHTNSVTVTVLLSHSSQ